MKTRFISFCVLALAMASGALFASSPEEVAIDFGIEDKTDAYVLETVKPQYPQEMLQRGIQGKTLLLLRVDERGEVSDVRVVSTSNDSFADAAIKSVKNWYFQPGTQNGVPVPQTVTVPVSFLIEDLKTPALASL
ncbi:energy transducer TonB [Pelagicoccus mobilis]|uniref:Energy transducer TonB n=1 Tax=Pelagicoccus mobilis TaxID=415221 RepID=A0A934RZX3_9BACT|nr:energy transducer TonB [Pelagicoccus mobilis]MBK1877362.1 energy transducer TonB [Pelagicoccus mobilis]